MPEPRGWTLHEARFAETVLGEARRQALDARNWNLTPCQLSDIELLLNGAFAPFEDFMSAAEYEGVVRLPSRLCWPIPVTLDVNEAFAAGLQPGDTIALRDAEGLPVAIMEVGGTWRPEKDEEARAVYSTGDDDYPGFSYLLHRTNSVYVNGRVFALEPIPHYDQSALRQSPAALRECFRKFGWQRDVAFQTRNPLHRATDDIDCFTRVRYDQRILGRFPRVTAPLSLFNLAMRMAGPREAVWHTIVRRNYRCTHFIVVRDHAAPGADGNGRGFYVPYDAQALMAEHELGIVMVPFQEVVYVENRSRYFLVDWLSGGDRALSLSGIELRRGLALGIDIPDWFIFPQIAAELRHAYTPRHLQGFTVLFTGLSGAGKSILANALAAMLRESDDRPVTLLDGDVVRKNLSSELGFSREHREINLRRIGFVATEIARHGGIAVCALIAPYAAARRELRETVEAVGEFVEVYVSTPLETCEARDPKGLYAKVRAGLIEGFTGIDDPYEVPVNPDITINTAGIRPNLAAERIFARLESFGYIR